MWFPVVSFLRGSEALTTFFFFVFLLLYLNSLSLLPVPPSRLSIYLCANIPAGPNYHSEEMFHFSFGSINGHRVCMLISSVSQERKTPPTRKVFFSNKAISHLSYSSLTEWFVFPGLRAPRPLEDICHLGEDAHRGGSLWSSCFTLVPLSPLVIYSSSLGTVSV